MNYTSDMAAEYLGVTDNTVARWARLGRFPGAWKDGARDPWLIPVEDLRAIRQRVEERAAHYLTARQAAERLGLYVGTIWAHLVEIPGVIREGGRSWIPIPELERWALAFRAVSEVPGSCLKCGIVEGTDPATRLCPDCRLAEEHRFRWYEPCTQAPSASRASLMR